MKTQPGRIGVGGPAALLAALLAGLLAVGACQPTIKIEAPDKPITINVNVRIQIERDVDALLKQDE